MTGTYTTRGFTMSVRDGGRRNYVETYTQPRWRHWAWRAYHRWDMLSFPLMRRLEPLDWWAHRNLRRCRGDCQTGLVGRRRNGEWTESVRTYCGHVPLTNRQDMRCHDLSMKGRELVAIRYEDEL